MIPRPLCLITGASAGIGAACAELAAQRGYDLILTYNSDKLGAQSAAARCTQHGAQTQTIQANVADPNAIDAIFSLVDATGPLAALINNAGVVGPAIRATDLTHDRLREMFDINVIGAMLVAAEAVKRMEPRGAGTIINITLSGRAAWLCQPICRLCRDQSSHGYIYKRTV